MAPALDQLAAAADGLDELHNSPAGRLRINLSRPAYWAVLARESPLSDTSIRRWSWISSLTMSLPISSQRSCDAGIRLGETLQQDMVAVAVSAPLELVVCASPEYFAQHARLYRLPICSSTVAWDFAIPGAASSTVGSWSAMASKSVRA